MAAGLQVGIEDRTMHPEIRVNLCSKANIIIKLFSCIIVIGYFLLILAADVGLAAFGVWMIDLGINGIR